MRGARSWHDKHTQTRNDIISQTRREEKREERRREGKRGEERRKEKRGEERRREEKRGERRRRKTRIPQTTFPHALQWCLRLVMLNFSRHRMHSFTSFDGVQHGMFRVHICCIAGYDTRIHMRTRAVHTTHTYTCIQHMHTTCLQYIQHTHTHACSTYNKCIHMRAEHATQAYIRVQTNQQ